MYLKRKKDALSAVKWLWNASFLYVYREYMYCMRENLRGLPPPIHKYSIFYKCA